MKLTAAQENAICAMNSELLVSAAAGSGKTAVLIERIYRLIKEEGYSLDRMLVCTFTNAAAGEMRERLETRFAKAVEEAKDETEKRAILQQAELVETAHISTLHGFCQKLIREHFETVHIDPQATMCDNATWTRLKNRAMEDCLEESYESAAAGDENLTAYLSRFTEREVLEMMDSLYGFLMALPHPFAWLEEWAEKKFTLADLETGEMARTMQKDCRLLLDGIMGLWEEACNICESPYCLEGYQKNIRSDGEILAKLDQASKRSLGELMEALKGSAFERLAIYRKLEAGEAEVSKEIKRLRDAYKKMVEEMKSRLPENQQQAIEDMNDMQPAMKGLTQMMKRMHTMFTALKRERGVIDFSDLEHMTLSILSHPALQNKIAARFDAIFVDEYQDISGIQETILEGLRQKASLEKEGEPVKNKGKDTLRFYVGDVKQSIYRFRQADPTLFMKKQETFETNPEAQQRKISLNHNFRSREGVLESINRVFSHVMRAEVTEIEYDEEAALHPGLSSERDSPAELHVINEGDFRGEARYAAEANIVAREILRKVGQQRYDREGRENGRWRYQDMVILLPSAKRVAPIVEKTLRLAGIPVYCEDGQESLESPEIRHTIRHLRLIDNIMDDFSLLAVLKGPLYRFSEEELANVRLQKPERKTSFLSAFEACSRGETALSLRCRQALENFAKERFLQRSMGLDEYLWGFLSRSGLYGYYGAQPGGKLRQANLRMLCTQASEHIKTRGGELRDFLASVTDVIGVKEKSTPTVLNPWEDVVRIMTIHKSKGLEFPWVFLMGLGGRLIQGNPRDKLDMHPQLGIALQYVNPVARTKRNTLMGQAIALRQEAEEKAERARVLYVALTRAQERILAIGVGKEEQARRRNTLHGVSHEVWSAKSMLEWIGQSLGAEDIYEERIGQAFFSTKPLRKTAEKSDFPTNPTSFPHKKGVWRVVFHIDADAASVSENMENRGDERVPEALEMLPMEKPSLLEMAYRAEGAEKKQLWDEILLGSVSEVLGLTHTPLKMGVTAFLRSQKEKDYIPAEEEEESPPKKRLPMEMSRPRLLEELPEVPGYLKEPEIKKGLLRGVATHKALSLLSLEELRKAAREQGNIKEDILTQAIAQSLQELVDSGRLTEEEREYIQESMLVAFFASSLGERVLASSEVHREWHFNLRLPDVCPGLLQGVIDLCFLWNGEWVLVDYKTDRVQAARELWKLYGEQVLLYKRALEAATGIPVAEAALFALALGESSTLREEEISLAMSEDSTIK